MNKPLTSILCLIALAIIIQSCNGLSSKSKYVNSDRYDFSSPKVIKLPQVFDEISGIVYYPKDTSIFAIIDEEGLLLKISLTIDASSTIKTES